MFQIIELLVLTLLFVVGGPLLVTLLLVGPTRFRKGMREFWNWLTNNRHSPEEVLEIVVDKQTTQLEEVRAALRQAEETESALETNSSQCEENIARFENEARAALEKGDEKGARASLLKQNLEELAKRSFAEQRTHEQNRIERLQKRLHLLELQLRQFEVGKTIFLSRLAEARTASEQYALANQFDPFDAIAQWREAEGALPTEDDLPNVDIEANSELVEMPLVEREARVDSDMVELRLAQLKTSMDQRPTTDQDGEY